MQLTLLNDEFFHGLDGVFPPSNLLLRESDSVDDLFQRLRDGVDVSGSRIRHVTDQKVLRLGTFHADVTILVNVPEAQLRRVQVIVARPAEELGLLKGLLRGLRL